MRHARAARPASRECVVLGFRYAPELEPMFRLLLDFMSRGVRSTGQAPVEPTIG